MTGTSEFRGIKGLLTRSEAKSEVEVNRAKVTSVNAFTADLLSSNCGDSSPVHSGVGLLKKIAKFRIQHIDLVQFTHWRDVIAMKGNIKFRGIWVLRI